MGSGKQPGRLGLGRADGLGALEHWSATLDTLYPMWGAEAGIPGGFAGQSARISLKSG